ncbi:hypothetical protein R5R35_014077 [Gryllus longicercus]|uniref:HTH cro/C1-type domain-containing protein n=1 Tax=Gryllus longicercus TaxID=2509291 RepID=A0AAN9VCK6_9ORTH
MADRKLPKNPKAYKAMEMIAKGKTQSDVADRLNVSQSTVSSWKRQIECPSGRSSSQNSSRYMEVNDGRRLAVVEPGRIVIQEQIRNYKILEAGSTQRRY